MLNLQQVMVCCSFKFDERRGFSNIVLAIGCCLADDALPNLFEQGLPRIFYFKKGAGTQGCFVEFLKRATTNTSFTNPLYIRKD